MNTWSEHSNIFTWNFKFLLLFLVLSFAGSGVDGFSLASTQRPSELFRGAPPIQYSTLSGPAFIANASTNHSVVVQGSTAVLTCAIRNLHNFTVSWIRNRDTRLLTTGEITYTSDKRFVTTNPNGSNQWMLKIHYARKVDTGTYLCQVSTTPPIMLSVNLTVVEALLRVYPGKEVHVQLGSRLELVCEAVGCRGSPLLSWTRAGHTIKEEDLQKSVTAHDANQSSNSRSTSKLILSHAKAVADHSGTYSCTSSCTPDVLNVTVHVLKGEELAAMQHLNSCPDVSAVTPTLLLLLQLLALAYFRYENLNFCWNWSRPTPRIT